MNKFEQESTDETLGSLVNNETMSDVIELVRMIKPPRSDGGAYNSCVSIQEEDEVENADKGNVAGVVDSDLLSEDLENLVHSWLASHSARLADRMESPDARKVLEELLVILRHK